MPILLWECTGPDTTASSHKTGRDDEPEPRPEAAREEGMERSHRPAAGTEGRKEPQIGLALGSGAARGLAHVGVIEELLRQGIEPAVVAGTSMGALVGALYAGDGLDRFARWVQQLDLRETLRLLDLRPRANGLIEGRKLMEFLTGFLADSEISDFRRRFAAVATDLALAREIWITEGSWLQAVRASIAIPGLLPPLRRDGRWLVDGSLVDPVPVAACRALGADLIIAVYVNSDLLPLHRQALAAESGEAEEGETEPATNGLGRLAPATSASLRQWLQELVSGLESGGASPAPSSLQLIYSSIIVMQDRITRSRLAGDPPEVLITPRVGRIGLFEFHRAGEAIMEGRRAVQRLMPALEALLARHS